MKFVADFHIHSKYSRATSPRMNLENIDKWAKIKGVNVIGTSDFTHPEWLKELKQKLEIAEKGLYKLKFQDKLKRGTKNTTRFILTTEISCIYSKNGKIRKNHILVFAPSFEVVQKINKKLNKIGNLKADGRPILGLDSKELVKIVLGVSKDCLIVPAHIWTPWFSLFGSKSGFNSLEECFEEYTKYIYAIETGISSSSAMNWRIKNLDKITLLSNSDSHSPEKIGREANVFDLKKINYFSIIEAIKSNNPKNFLYTIEIFPKLGKYYYDGHQKCKICLSPKETKKLKEQCPICKRRITIGVLNRIEELAMKNKKIKPKGIRPFKNLVPLREIIAECLKIKTLNSKKVSKEYENLIEKFQNEFNILLNVSYKKLILMTSPQIAQTIIQIRKGKVVIKPGYDGVCGKLKIKI